MKLSETEHTSGVRIRASLELSPKSLTKLLAAATVVLLVIHVTLQVLHYQVGEVHWLLKDTFDVDEEQNIPTWFSAMLLLLSTLLLFTIARVRRAENAADAGYWRALTIGFLCLSLDEVAGIHEILNTIPDELHGKSEFNWTYIGAPVFVIVSLVFLRFLSRLPRIIRNGFCAAGIIYGSGAIGIEFVSHLYLKTHDIDTLAYNLLTALEEGLEMGGVIFYIHVLMTYIKTIPALTTPSERLTSGSLE